MSLITSLSFICKNIKDKKAEGFLSDFIEAVLMYSVIGIDVFLIVGFINLIFN
jgi:hypothetical protein